MAITFDAANNGGQGSNEVPTVAITVAADATLAVIAINAGNGAPGTVLFNGNAVTAIADLVSTNGWDHSYLYYYVLQGGDKGGSKNVTADGSPEEGAMGVVTLKGTETSSPVRASNTAENDTDGPVTVDVGGLTAGDWVIDGVAWYDNQVLTEGAGQTDRTQIGGANSGSGIAMSTEEATGASVTMSWTNASLDDGWATVAVAIKAAAEEEETTYPTVEIIADFV